MSALKIIQAFAKKSLTKNQGSGIISLPSDFMAAEKAGQIALLLERAGIPTNQLDDFIRSETDLVKYLNIIEAANKPTVYSGQAAMDQLNKLFPKKGEVFDLIGNQLDPNKPIIGGTQGIETLLKKGALTKGTVEDAALEKSRQRVRAYKQKLADDEKNNVKDRKMFKEANEKFNKTDIIADTVTKMISMEPVAAMKEANKVLGRKGIYKNLTEEQSQKILKDTDDWIFQRDPSDLYDYKKNRPFRDDPNFDPDDPDFDPDQGYYTGGMVDVEPNLSDIGHGSDSLMARTRLISPNNQATTSTGLNYLLAEDNDNIRVPFSAGGGGRRAFLKLMAALTGGVAAAKSGILSLGGKEAGKQAAKEVVKSAGSGRPPPYFFKLVEKIKFMGDDTLATQDKAIAKKYKDYVMEEDFAGNIEIIKKGEDVAGNKLEDVYMKYTVDEVPLKNKKGSSKVEEYEEFTARPDMEGKMKDVEQGVPDEVIEEAGDTTAMTLKKADGGRIGFSGGNLAKFLADRTITGSSRKFLEKVFGKEKFENMIRNDPEMHRGMLEVVEMFRNRDKEGLKMYLQKFLPHMDDATVEDFIIGSGDTAGIEGQLIRLGSGRDYKGKIEMIKEADNIRKLNALDVSKMKPNAEGGRIELKGGGDALKALLNYFAKEAGKKGSDQLKDINPKALGSGIANIMGPQHLKMLQKNQTDYLEHLLNVIKSDKKFLDQNKKLAETMMKDAPEGFEDQAQNIVKMMVESTMGKGGRLDRMKIYDKINVDDAIVDVEQMIKNRRVKESDGRALNASGGLQAMLGE